LRPGLRQLDEQFQQKCAAVLRPGLRQLDEQFQQKCAAVLRPELRRKTEQFLVELSLPNAAENKI
jgi:hypothetical protein